ncbi:XdhC family protein [Paenibacillus sp. TSA_86.1]|uniref:XdhC family protein n=1 Tax=Paenibacillus sp. TSA_86.1 TaxID=3415649 RepID=UPI0040465553
MEMHDLCAIAIRETRSVLATAIKVEGHAYRKQGVCMILTEDGRMYGSISPGCLESDLQMRVSRVLETERFELATYDMRPEDDLSWGETIGCGGLVVVLIEPIIGGLRYILQQMQLVLDTGSMISFCRTFNDGYSDVQYECSRIGSSHWIKPWNISHPHSFTSHYAPKPRLIIIGAGNDVVPVARLSQSAGFRVFITDWRDSFCTPERFPEAVLIQGFPQEVFSQLNIMEQDYILLMSHQFQREREMVELLVGSQYAYLGIMGSRTRTARLLDGLPPLDHVRSPVGLSIGADGPEEIAISIVAELIACRRQRRTTGNSALMVKKRSGAYANDRYRSGGG